MKAKIRKTGEIVDIICYVSNTQRNKSDYVRYVDSEGVEHNNENMNYYWDFKRIYENSEVDWEQRRYEIAKAAMQGMMTTMPDDSFCHVQAKECIEIADELIKQLKGE